MAQAYVRSRGPVGTSNQSGGPRSLTSSSVIEVKTHRKPVALPKTCNEPDMLFGWMSGLLILATLLSNEWKKASKEPLTLSSATQRPESSRRGWGENGCRPWRDNWKVETCASFLLCLPEPKCQLYFPTSEQLTSATIGIRALPSYFVLSNSDFRLAIDRDAIDPLSTC